MSLNGKKINELDQISTVTSETVLPAVYVNGSDTASAATKVSVSQLASNIRNGMVIEPTIVTDTTSTTISLSNILANTIYQYGTLTSLTISGFETSYNQSSVYFTTSNISFTANFGSSFVWLDGNTPTFELGKSYIIRLVNGICYLENDPTLPIATNNQLGTIKVGSGLEITQDGTLSATGGSGSTYTAGYGIEISDSDEISVSDKVWTEDNLIAGTNIEIVKQVNPNVLDPETTLACYHFNGNKDNVMTSGVNLSSTMLSTVTSYSDESTYPWATGQKAGLLNSQSDIDTNLFDGTISGIGSIGDFTLEFRLRHTNSYGIIFIHGGPTNAAYPQFYDMSANTFRIGWDSNGNYTNVSVTPNQWYHIAFVRHNGIVTIYVDGVSKGSVSSSVDITNFYYHIGGGNLTEGIAEVVLTKEAKWTDNFTPPTEPYVVDSEGGTYRINSTLTDFTGTSGSAVGTSGLVPAPAITDAGKYLKADGTWSTPSGGGSSLPDQTGQSGKFLTTNGSEASWGTPSAATVSSLGLVKPDGVTLGINNGTLYVAESIELPQDVYSRTTLLPGNHIDFATTHTGNKNYTVVGDMTIVDEVASNFSKNNYLNTPDYISAEETLDSLELVIKLTKITSSTSFSQTGIYSIGDQNGFKLTISTGGYLRLRVSEDTVSNAVDITGRNSLSDFAVNTPIWVKVTYSSSSGYEMFISEDGDWWTSDADSYETFRPYRYESSNLTYLGWNGNSPLSMFSMSLRDCYLKINGTPVWVGSTYRDVKRVDATYAAGTGIDIESDEISVDNTVYTSNNLVNGNGIEFSNAIKQTAVTYTAHSSYVCSSDTITIDDSDVIEYQLKFKYENQSFSQILFAFSKYGAYQETVVLSIDGTDVNPGICQLSVKTPGYSASQTINATSALEDGKTYFLKLAKDSSKNYKVDYSEDGETWNNLIPLTLVSDYSINSSMTAYIGTAVGVIDSAASYWLHNTWYLEDTYLKINGNYVIKGSENFGYTTIGSPTIVTSYITSDKTSINLDTVKVAHLAMPSTVYEDLTIPASGTVLQAPADGYIIARQDELYQLSLATLDRNEDGANYITGFFWSNAAAALTLPVSKGGYFCVYWFGTPVKLRFVYAKGSESEYTPS